MHFRTSRLRAVLYSRSMQLKHKKATSTAGWVAAVGAVGLFAGVASLSGWLALAACAALPPFVMMRFWRGPDQSMSESIQNALR